MTFMRDDNDEECIIEYPTLKSPNSVVSPRIESYILFGFVTVIILVLLTPALFFQPDFPKPIFHINSAFSYPLNISSSSSNHSYLTSSWNLSIAIEIVYNTPLICQDVQAFVLLNDFVVSSTMVPDFSFERTQGRYKTSEEKKILVDLASSHVPINQFLVETLNRERISDGALTFSFIFKYIGIRDRSDYTVMFMKDSERIKHVTVFCENMKLTFASNLANSPAFSMKDFFCTNV